MKKTILASTIIASAFLSGCVVHKQIITKSTVFGFQASTPMVGSAGAIAVQFGLIRSEYISNPTSIGTNIFAAPLTSHVQANLNPLTQSATEDIGTK